jgi:hypothetical protein
VLSPYRLGRFSINNLAVRSMYFSSSQHQHNAQLQATSKPKPIAVLREERQRMWCGMYSAPCSKANVGTNLPKIMRLPMLIAKNMLHFGATFNLI